MSDVVKCGLIQLSNPINDESVPVADIQKAMYDKHIPYIEKAGEQGVQILCLQEIFNGPYFCPSQDKRWYDAAEPVPGPTTEALSEYAKKYSMVIVVPVYEKEIRGVYYNTAAVIDADGTYLGKYRKQHIPQVAGFWEKFFFKPGNGGYPVQDEVCHDRRLHLLRPALPRGRSLPGSERRRDRLQPVGHGRRTLAVSLEGRAAGARGRERLLRRRDQPGRHRGALEHRQVLRHQLLREPARPVRRGGLRG